jgi:hypothetical protein
MDVGVVRVIRLFATRDKRQGLKRRGAFRENQSQKFEDGRVQHQLPGGRRNLVHPYEFCVMPVSELFRREVGGRARLLIED